MSGSLLKILGVELMTFSKDVKKTEVRGEEENSKCNLSLIWTKLV